MITVFPIDPTTDADSFLSEVVIKSFFDSLLSLNFTLISSWDSSDWLIDAYTPSDKPDFPI